MGGLPRRRRRLEPDARDRRSASDIQPSPNRGFTRIAFATYRGDNYDVYTMNPDGSGKTRLTYAAEHDVNPAWSRDGSRIVFESHRTGDGDIYAMNADGSNVARLTTDAAWDGEPAWSPDGTKIAFTSHRNSVYRIWRMNADGSNLVQLSSQPYSEHAAWSPDGSLIAFDADGNGDGWQELWLMNADGTNQHEVYDPAEPDTDAWAGSWSPDGRYVAFTRISWIYYQGQWYWITAYLDAWDSLSGSVSPLSLQGEDWRPDWQTIDVLPPSSSVMPMPAHSPSPVSVSWSGTDAGPAGLASYDVQVREEPGGAWNDWLVETQETFASYEGLGGHGYAFRCRARDLAGNVEPWPAGPDATTTVEALPPQTAVSPLPPYVRGEVTVAWGGADPGLSGIAHYDVQLRDGAGGWTDWQMGVTQTEAPFSGEPGHTYFFRSRGVDRAQNVEPWPPGDGDASTAFYVWSITGTLRDNRETPVMGGSVSLIPEALAAIPSDGEGAYTGYEAMASGVYTATWEKAGYSSLPPTAFSGASDAHADMILPPADNAVLNWGFETGSLEPEWLADGAILPGVASGLPHSGGFSAAIGQPIRMFAPWVNLSNSAAHSARPSVAVDGTGAVHVVWIEFGSGTDLVDVLYTRREPGGGWSAPANVSGSQQASQLDSFLVQLAVQADGTAHVAWPCGVPGSEDVFYNRRAPDGTWSVPVNVSQNGHPAQGLDMVLAADGALHLVWQDRSASDVMYAQRAPDGTWSAVTNVSQTAGWSDTALVAAGVDGTAHVVWSDQTPGNREVFYARRASDGTWSAPLNLSSGLDWSGPGGLAVAADGGVHVAGTGGAVYYAFRNAGGTWSDPVQVADPALGGGALKLALGPDGSVHLVWGWGSVRYARRGADGVWSPAEEVASAYGCEWHELRVDSTGTAHTTCSGWLQAYDALYLRRPADGAWSGWINVSNTAEYSTLPRLALDATDGVHVVWMEGPQYGNLDIFYAASAGAQETGDSILSQELTVPPEAAAPTLSFWYRLEGLPTPSVSWFGVQVDDGAVATGLFTGTSLCDWTHAWFDLSPWAGQAVTLRFLVHQTEGQPAVGASLDEVSVSPAYPDVWVGKASLAESASPGTPVVFFLRYGNRGGVPAADVTLVDVLPPELQFLAANPPPTSVSPQLTWEAGDLLPGSGPFTLTLTATVAPGALLMQTVTNTVTVEAATPELEGLNNQAHARIWVGYRIALPLIVSSW